MTHNGAVERSHLAYRSAQGESAPVETRNKWRHLELLLVIALVVIYLVWFTWPLCWSASENLRLVGTFNTDEEAHASLLKKAIDNRSLQFWYPYGYAYLNMGLLPLLTLSYFTPVSEQHIIVWLRIISALFAAGVIVSSFLMARRYSGRLVAWLSIFLLSFTVLNFMEMSVMSHPDIAQLFFLVLGVYFCCRLAEDGQLQWLILASAAAGLAFSCKYVGLLLVPLIGLYGLLNAIRMDPAKIKVNSDRVIRISRILAALMGVALLSIGAVVISYVAVAYAGAEYYGVSMPRFFGLLRTMFILAGVSLVLVAVLPFLWTFIRPRPRLAYLLKLGLLAIAAFAGAVFVTSPFNVFSVRSSFMRGFLYESLHAGFGHEFKEAPSGLLWLNILMSPQLLDPLLLGLTTLSLVLTIYQVTRGGWRRLLQADSVMWVWVLVCLGFIVLRVSVRNHRSLLPVIPFLLIFAACAVNWVIQCATARLPKRFAAATAVVGLLIIVGLELPPSLGRIIQFRRATIQREKTSVAVQVGHWLAENYAPSTRILYDPFSYIPPSFADAYVTPWGGTLQMIGTLDPAVVVVHKYTASLFSDKSQAATFARDEALFIAKYEYYAALREGNAGYALTGDFGNVQVYARQ